MPDEFSLAAPFEGLGGVRWEELPWVPRFSCLGVRAFQEARMAPGSPLNTSFPGVQIPL